MTRVVIYEVLKLQKGRGARTQGMDWEKDKIDLLLTRPAVFLYTPFPSFFEARDMECSSQIEAQSWNELLATCVSGKKHA